MMKRSRTSSTTALAFAAHALASARASGVRQCSNASRSASSVRVSTVNTSGQPMVFPIFGRGRALYAVIAPTLIGADYQIDRSRIYLTGMSGGGKMASMVAVDHAHLFKGAVFNCGVEFWDKKPARLEQVKETRERKVREALAGVKAVLRADVEEFGERFAAALPAEIDRHNTVRHCGR